MFRKPLFISLSYSYLVYLILQGEESVSFTLLFSLQIELLLILLVFVILSFRSNSFDKRLKSIDVLFSSIVLIAFSYAIAYACSYHFNEFIPRNPYHKINLIDPLVYFKEIIFTLILGLSFSYALELIKLYKIDNSYKVIEQMALYQGILIWTINCAGVIGLFIFGSYNKVFILSLIIAARILSEYFIRRRFLNLTVSI